MVSVVSQSFCQVGSSSDGQESADILKLRLQMKISKSEECCVQATNKTLVEEKAMTRERVELWFRTDNLRYAGASASKTA